MRSVELLWTRDNAPTKVSGSITLISYSSREHDAGADGLLAGGGPTVEKSPLLIELRMATEMTLFSCLLPLTVSRGTCSFRVCTVDDGDSVSVRKISVMVMVMAGRKKQVGVLRESRNRVIVLIVSEIVV